MNNAGGTAPTVLPAQDFLDRVLDKGERAGLAQIVLQRIAMRHLHDELSEIATFAHRTAGGVSLRPRVLQRRYRDAHGGRQHVLLADEICQQGGRILLGVTGEGARCGIYGVLE